MSGLPQYIAQSIAAIEIYSLGPDSRECTICREGLQEHEGNEIAARLRCGHVFGMECITTWLKLRETCPMCRASAYKVPPSLVIWRKHRDYMIGFIQRLFEDPANSTAILLRGLEFLVNNTSTHEVSSRMTNNACWQLHQCLGDLAAAGWIEYIQFFEGFLQHAARGILAAWDPWDEDLEASRLIAHEIEHARGMVGWAVLPGHQHS